MTGLNVMSPLVLKIGGSLAAGDRLGEVLNRVMRSPRRIIVVPGGGGYADAVRFAQANEGFSDAEAHRRAIFAMHRMAADFQNLEPALVPAETLDDMVRVWAASGKPVWLPWTLVEHEPAIPQNWSMTSDGLAAWLADKLGGAEVALVKSCSIPPDALLDELARAHITDAQFPRIVEAASLSWHVLCADDRQRIDTLLNIKGSD